MRWIGALLLVAACGPRGMMSSHPVTDTVTDTGTDTDTGTATDTDTDSGSPPIDQRGALVFSRLPSPHRFAAAPLGAAATVAAARALVGHRDRRAPLAIALDLAAQLTRAPPIPARTEVELIAWAQDRSAWKSVPAIVAGDLLIFDRAVDGAPASLVAVALGRDPRGVVEMIYVARGVVRRGFVDPSRPRVARDRDRRAVNTYLRHGTALPPTGTRYLAGELFAGVVTGAAR